MFFIILFLLNVWSFTSFIVIIFKFLFVFSISIFVNCLYCKRLINIFFKIIFFCFFFYIMTIIFIYSSLWFHKFFHKFCTFYSIYNLILSLLFLLVWISIERNLWYLILIIRLIILDFKYSSFMSFLFINSF